MGPGSVCVGGAVTGAVVVDDAMAFVRGKLLFIEKPFCFICVFILFGGSGDIIFFS